VLDHFPVIGAAVWLALLATAALRQPDWRLLPEAFKGTVFLLALVTCASLMPVERLPAASWQTAFGLGFISAVFDNIPLTALAIKQGGYDWGMLAYTVGFGGSMIWFGSSAGVALSNMYPQAKSVGAWVRHGWHVALAYVVGFVVMLALLGWNPHEPRKASAAASAAVTQSE
jgi:Na+/H+ antiporter NhaD/arsenite permease-like protein